MHHDNKILISAILILGIALVSLNLFGISGNIGTNVQCEKSWATVSPTVGKAGDNFNIQFYSSPDKAGVNYNGIAMPIKINQGSNGPVIANYVRIDGCQGSTCDGGSITLNTASRSRNTVWQDNTYYVSAIDRCTNDREILTSFTIKGSR